MATISTGHSASDDEIRKAATGLAFSLGAMIDSASVDINTGVTALAIVLAVSLITLPEEEFESTVSTFCAAVKINRASLQRPPKSVIN